MNIFPPVLGRKTAGQCSNKEKVVRSWSGSLCHSRKSPVIRLWRSLLLWWFSAEKERIRLPEVTLHRSLFSSFDRHQAFSMMNSPPCRVFSWLCIKLSRSLLALCGHSVINKPCYDRWKAHPPTEQKVRCQNGHVSEPHRAYQIKLTTSALENFNFNSLFSCAERNCLGWQ